ncbi:MAG TPA: hypothetical protein VIY27_02540, partial [Myxococcota bacterium]
EGGAGRPIRWEPVALPTSGEAPGALALDAIRGRLVVGDARGVIVAEPDGAARRVLRRGPVHDVALLPDGAVLAATGEGLYRVDPAAHVTQIRIGSGEAVRAVRRVSVAGGLIGVASLGGVHLSRDGRTWRRPIRLPQGEAALVALRVRGDAAEVWAVLGRELWSARVGARAPLAAAGPAQRVHVPGAPRDGGPVDVAFDLPDAETLLVFRSALVARSSATGAWRVLRPVLPPGASALRIAHALGHYWLATDAGLLVAAALEGPWRRAADPAGGRAVSALASGPDALLVATRQAVLRAAEPSRPLPPTSADAAPRDPDVVEVHRVALAYLSLQPAQMRDMQRGVRRRGWLPILSLHVGHDRGAARRWDHDQSFLSGDTRELYDEQRDRDRDLALGLTLSWDFGDAAFHPEEIDVSRESRAVIELRDDVLDEITQLYFERLRTLGEIAALEAGSPQLEALRQRAAELAAGLDAWTGGWFSRRAGAP